MFRSIYYVGETNDHSDQWLIRLLKERFAVNVLTPADFLPPSDCSLVINRLYGSAVSRHGERIEKILELLRDFEMSNTPVINSTAGYDLEAQRLEQYKLFSKTGLCYVPTVLVKSVNSSLFKPPYVLKDNSAFRNKKLRIIRSLTELDNISEEIGRGSVLQPLIEANTCYRTEFVGISHITFSQLIKTMSENLTFQYTGEIIPTPLKPGVIRKLINLTRNIGIQTFSVEYFLRKENAPEIVDFNMNSNYQPFLIKEAGDIMKEYWLNLINNYATITRYNVIG